MDLGVVGAGLLGRIDPLGGRTSQLLLNLRLLRVERLLLGLLASLDAGNRHLIVRLGLLLDGAEQLRLALLSARVLLLDGLLHALLLGALSRVTPLANQQHLLVLLARFLLDARQLLVALRLRRRELLAQHFDDALALGALLRRLALLGEAHAIETLSHLLDLTGHGLGFALVGPV